VLDCIWCIQIWGCFSFFGLRYICSVFLVFSMQLIVFQVTPRSCFASGLFPTKMYQAEHEVGFVDCYGNVFE
jgi:dipeptide/tripeptide permease